MKEKTGEPERGLSMKQVCDLLDMTYETLRFYCEEGLVPNVKRDKNNCRVFGERDVRWLQGLQCLRRCGMGIKEMKQYMELCLAGKDTIPQRKAVLHRREELLLEQIAVLQRSVEFIEQKQAYFDAVLAGEVPYTSNLIQTDGAEG